MLCYYCSNKAIYLYGSYNVCGKCYVFLQRGTHPAQRSATGASNIIGSPMPFYTRHKQTARLIYEPSLQGYSLSFSYNEAIVEFVKKAIPSHKRTYDPTTKTWYFGSEYFDIIRTLFDGHRNYTLTIVTQAEVEQRIKETEEASQHQWAPAQYSIEDELKKFTELVSVYSDYISIPLEVIKNMTKAEATKVYRKVAMKLHPDKNGDPKKMSELNSTWAILKEGYYIK